jgi:hypothetical protein
MASEVSVLRDFGRAVRLRKRWIKMWQTLGQRILKMPEWMQEILLEDVNTAVKNRIAVMEMIQNAKRNP